MLSVSFQSDVREVFDRVRKEHQRQIPFAASLALNEMAFETREYLKDQMDVRYDGGAVKYTKNAIYSTRSNKRNLEAKVFVGGNDPHRIRYILNTIEGGTAYPRKVSLTEPVKGRIRLTKVGRNIPKGAIARMAKKPGYFLVSEGEGMPPGLYQRVGKGNRTKIKMIVAFHDTKQHKITFPARSLAAEYAKKHFRSILFRNFRKALKTAR